MKLFSRFLSVLLCLCLLLPSALAEAPTRVFVDDTGREVTLPAAIRTLAVTGSMAQIVVFALAPEKMIGISNAWDASAEGYLAEEYYRLPVLGQLYGGKGEMNLETLLAAAPDVVIDVGEGKDGLREDMDALAAQTGIPFVHISAATKSMGAAYRRLGDLLGKPDEAEALAAWCEATYARGKVLAERVEKASVLYVIGADGLSVLARGSYHAGMLDLMTSNAAVVDHPSSKGTGNEVDMEQILLWNPDYVLFAHGSIYDTVADDPAWKALDAIRSGHYAEAPYGPHNWMGFPPSVQQLLGMLWMGALLYPDAVDYDLYTEVAAYYRLFYHCELTPEMYANLTRNAGLGE